MSGLKDLNENEVLSSSRCMVDKPPATTGEPGISQ